MRLSSLPSLAPFPVLSALFVPSRILSSPLHYDLDDGSSASSMSEERTTGVRHEMLNRSISMKRTCDPSVYFQDSSLPLRFFSPALHYEVGGESMRKRNWRQSEASLSDVHERQMGLWWLILKIPRQGKMTIEKQDIPRQGKMTMKRQDHKM